MIGTLGRQARGPSGYWLARGSVGDSRWLQGLLERRRIVCRAIVSAILFDEYLNYPGWAHHEHRAFVEFIQTAGLMSEYVGYNARYEQVAAKRLLAARGPVARSLVIVQSTQSE